MTYDPRSIANAILDIASEWDRSLTNIDLQKIIFFAHADSLHQRGVGLVSVSFEAWQYGPVLPILYHEFKSFKSEAISGRATRLCKRTGVRIEATYNDLNVEDLDFLRRSVRLYSNLSSSALVELSHAEGGAWDLVWNGSECDTLGLKITDDVIRQGHVGKLKDDSGRKHCVH